MPLLQYEWSLWIQALSQGPAIPAFFSQSLREWKFFNCIYLVFGCAGPWLFSSCETGDYSPSRCGASWPRLLLSRSSGSRAHRLGSSSVARGVLRCQALNPCPALGRWIPSTEPPEKPGVWDFVQLPSCAVEPALACSFAKRAICAPLPLGASRVRGSEGADCACHGHRLASLRAQQRGGAGSGCLRQAGLAVPSLVLLSSVLSVSVLTSQTPPVCCCRDTYIHACMPCGTILWMS